MTSKKLILALLIAFSMPVYAQTTDMSLVPYRKGDLWGYASPDRVITLKPEYQEANLFHEGYAVVKKGGKYGYIDRGGKLVIPFKFYSAKPFRIGYVDVSGNSKPGDGSLNAQKTVLFAGAAPGADGYEICIDTKGQKIPKCPAINENSAPDVNKKNTVTVQSNYSTIQKSDLFDKIVADYKMPGSEETYYIATRNNNFGVFNKTFEVIVPFEYSKIEKINIGVMAYLMVEKNGMKGLLFGNGSSYMPVENSRLDYVEAANGSNYFIFTKDGLTGLKNTKYQVLVEPTYKDISYDKNGGFILTGSQGWKGFYFQNNSILEPKYLDVKPVKGADYVMVQTRDGKWGYVNNRSVEFFE